MVRHLLSSAPWLLGTPGTNRANFFSISREEAALLLKAWQITLRHSFPQPPATGCQASQWPSLLMNASSILLAEAEPLGLACLRLQQLHSLIVCCAGSNGPLGLASAMWK